MGVLNCARPACHNIMCDTYVPSVGYVCSDCKTEFKEYLSKNGLNPETHGQIMEELEKFMNTSKDHPYNNEETSVDGFFDEYTR